MATAYSSSWIAFKSFFLWNFFESPNSSNSSCPSISRKSAYTQRESIKRGLRLLALPACFGESIHGARARVLFHRCPRPRVHPGTLAGIQS
jgi:hypothetical protein